MRIGVDAGCLGISDKRLKVGVYQTAKHLLIELGKMDKNNDYILYSFYPISKELMKLFGNRMINKVSANSFAWSKLQLPLFLTLDKTEVFLALGQFVSSLLFVKPKIIGFVYDISFEKYPELYPDSYNELSKNTKHLVKKSDVVHVISQATKKDLVKIYKASSRKIIVNYPGVSSIFTKKTRKDNLSKNYFLYVGALKRTKNIPTIIKAFSEFIRKTKKDCKLLLIGGNKWMDPEIEIQLGQISKEIRNKVHFKGYISDKQLVAYYKDAIAFVCPSFYEGFGLTFLEAMACGCPVIGSNKGSIPEVIGDAGILVESNDAIELSKAMLTFYRNKSKRQNFIKNGYKRVRRFSWNKFAYTVLESIKKYNL